LWLSFRGYQYHLNSHTFSTTQEARIRNAVDASDIAPLDENIIIETKALCRYE